MSDVTSIGPTSLGATLADSMRDWGNVAEAFGIAPPDFAAEKKFFAFYRRKDHRLGRWGWDVMLWIGRHGVNLVAYGVAPFERHLLDAEDWAWHFADRHGFKAMKRVKPRRQKFRQTLRLIQGGAAMGDQAACDGCDATGKVDGKTCPACGGTGRLDVRGGK